MEDRPFRRRPELLLAPLPSTAWPRVWVISSQRLGQIHQALWIHITTYRTGTVMCSTIYVGASQCRAPLYHPQGGSGFLGKENGGKAPGGAYR